MNKIINDIKGKLTNEDKEINQIIKKIKVKIIIKKNFVLIIIDSRKIKIIYIYIKHIKIMFITNIKKRKNKINSFLYVIIIQKNNIKNISI